MNPPQMGGMMSDNMMNSGQSAAKSSDKAPDFTLKTPDDQTVRLSDVHCQEQSRAR